MYVIQSGQVEVLHTGPDNETIRLAILSKGDLFGEMALFHEETRSATVKAKGNVSVLVIDKRIFLKRVHEDPSFAYSILQRLSTRISDLNNKLSILSTN